MENKNTIRNLKKQTNKQKNIQPHQNFRKKRRGTGLTPRYTEYPNVNVNKLLRDSFSQGYIEFEN